MFADFLLDLLAERQADPHRNRTLLSGILRSADEHFDEVIVQRVIELALELPRELRALEVAGMNRKNVHVHAQGVILQIILQVDQNLDDAVSFPG